MTYSPPSAATFFAAAALVVQSLALPGIFGGIMNTAFDSWLAKQITEGLVDIRFAVIAGRGVSAEELQTELLAAEAAINMGNVRAAPAATSMMPADIAAFVAQH